jgi:hypothetical protein
MMGSIGFGLFLFTPQPVRFMKYFVTVLLVLIIMLTQSCGLSRKYRDAESMNYSQAEEINLLQHQLDESRLLSDDLTERLNLKNEEYQEIYENYLILSEQGKETRASNDKSIHDPEPVKMGYMEYPEYQPAKYIPYKGVDSLKETRMKFNSGNVAFYCPRKVNYKETFTAIGFITDVISDKEIKAKLTKRVKEVELDSAGVELSDDKILIEKIRYYKLIELRLDPASNGSFEIIKVHLEDKQEVNDEMEGWQWNITPVSNQKDQKLVLKVIVYDESGKVDSVFNKTRFVEIEVSSFAFFRNTKLLFVENPEWAYGSVILPFITFLFGMYQKRKKTKAGQEEEPAKVGTA